jgi:hypothetical protein
MEVPPGVDPHDSRKGVIIGVTAFTLTVAFITVALRVYTRAVILRQFKLDDYTAVVAFVGSTRIFGSIHHAILNP